MDILDSPVKTWETYFPYEPRPVQVGIINTIVKQLETKTHMVLEAANGAGKTIAALAATLPYAKRNGLKIIYLARTHTQIDRVLQELQEVSKSVNVTGIAMRGRESFCLNPLVLKYAKNNHAVHIMCSQLKTAKKCVYYTNMNDEAKLLPVLANLSSRPATAEYIFDLSQAAEICPAETARKLLQDVDVIACSYLYLFDSGIRPSFLDQIDCDLQDIIVIIDEAHNLPEMVNNIASDNISSFSFSAAIREARTNDRYDFISFMDSCVEYLTRQNKKLPLHKENSLDPAFLLEELELSCNEDLDDEFFAEMIDLGEAIRFRLAKQGKEPRSSLGRIGEFFFKFYDSIGKKDYSHSLKKQKFSDSRDTFVTLNLNSLDPSKVIYPVLRDVSVSISMSGTIGNPDAYQMLTGINNLKSMANLFPSPYDKSNIQSFVVKELTTMYNRRSPMMWTNIVKAIAALASETPKNMGVFTPSYSILRQLIEHGLEREIDKPLIVAKEGMSSSENDKLVEKFKSLSQKGGAILCSVLGGRSSEGADFPGELMQSVAVVGIPYAPPSVKSDAQIKYLDSKFPGSGRLLAYQIPAINRASQAAGRPVRGLNDRAFILLLDFRFGTSSVLNLLPQWIQHSIDKVPNDPQKISKLAKKFFSR
ncbi:MAG: ATP-dependent DNA helicase [Candidatus Heimdallarchaeota archaeon LC_2]|nr:MAG: ATP-dependent DNA helicase [Candidatus Heimdallarchaeota archaeon LC_2]